MEGVSVAVFQERGGEGPTKGLGSNTVRRASYNLWPESLRLNNWGEDRLVSKVEQQTP